MSKLLTFNHDRDWNKEKSGSTGKLFELKDKIWQQCSSFNNFSRWKENKKRKLK